MGVRSYIWGRFSGQAVLAALIACGLDQAHKYWMIHVFDMPHRGLVRLTPFFDLIMVWNRGISYGLFQQHSAFGQTVLIVISVVTVLALLVWIAQLSRRWAALSLGLIIGGAMGNAIDRMVYGAVADFFSLHAYGYHWYVFNLADMAIVAGVALLMYETFMGRDGDGHKKAGNEP
ncbi:MAG: signal peptidase II [Hyphomicrobiales bacterium]|nr:MAG: signal peptidase II [Hyphomicrobiales bacterium]